MKSRKKMRNLLVILFLIVISISVAYAALSTNLTVTASKITQNALTWNVGFTGTSATATSSGTSNTGLSCGTATITSTSVTIANSTLSKPGDTCIYALTIKNSGTIPAKLNTITPTAPTSVTCGTASGGLLVCGNITYRLASNNAGTTTLTTGGVLAANATLPVYLSISYTGTGVNSSAVTQNSAKFTINYVQS